MRSFARGSDRSLRKLATLAAYIIFSAVIMQGQSTGNAMVSGTVTDPSGNLGVGDRGSRSGRPP